MMKKPVEKKYDIFSSVENSPFFIIADQIVAVTLKNKRAQTYIFLSLTT